MAEALGALGEPGLEFIYSSELVPDSLRVLEEPRAGSRLLTAREILAQHGLALQLVRTGLFAVVRDTHAAAAGGAPADGAPDAATQLTPLAEVVVSTSRYALEGAAPIGAVQVSGIELAAQPVLGEDAIRALGRLPGMAQNGFSARSNVRGGETGETLTLVDGFPIREAFHHPAYNSAFGVLDSGLIADAEVYTGGFPVRYGNRMAGVFDFETIDPRRAATRALGVSVFDATARYGGVQERTQVDWLATARIGTLRPFLDAFSELDAKPINSDLYARVGYGDADRLRLTANFLWAYDELDIEREALGEDAEFNSRVRYAWLRADHAWDERLAGSAWLGYSQVTGNRSGSMEKAGIAIGAVRDRRSSRYLDFRGRVTWQPAPRHWLEGGLEFTEEDAGYEYAAAAQYDPAVAALFSRDTSLSRVSSLTPSRERGALFAAHRWQVLDSVVSELGLRAQRTATQGTTTKEWLFDPRLSVRWQVFPSTALRAHWGRFHQTDEVHELKVEDGLTAFPEAQRSDQFIVGADHQLANGLALRLEWFRKLQSDPRPHFENLLDPMSVLPEIAPDRVEVAPLSSEVRGAEFTARHSGDAFSWWTTLAWSEAWDGVAGRRVPRSWDQSWAATAGLDWIRGNWRLGAVATSHRGWPTTIINDDRLGPRNDARFPARAALDLRAEYRRPLAVGSLSVSFEVTNAVSVGNTCCYELLRSDDGAGGVAFSTRESDWLPIVPSFGVLWEF
ncbi:MAG: TonB-dependent receptor plug domain-containing protein [Steroidobacteraceae bacterium]